VNPLVSTEEDLLMKEIMEGIERVEKERQNEMSSKVVTATKIHIEYDDVYFDGENLKEEANEVKSDDENVSSDSEEERYESDDDGYDGYGGYNEYGECDRGYYYRDGGYERKTSPMMSPIISPVTA
jgi:hypothetical protein